MTTISTCGHCGGDLGPGDGFCAHCGAAVCRCPECGAALLPGDPACPRCRAPVDLALFPHPFLLPPIGDASIWTDMVERLRRATLGEFEIGQELGRGGMAAVFLAHEISLDRQVAIKVMSPGLFLGEGIVDRFRHEAITIAQLHHPNIVSVYSVRQVEGLHFFVMRYVRGRSLEQVIQQAGKLPLPMVRSILHQVGSALTYAHRHRVVHRDVKPGNILIDGDGNAVVTDFGIAKAAESPTRTITGALVGTPAYMSPEQCRGTEVSGASDQYALGAVAYEMLTGEPPFGGSTFTILQAHVERPPLPLRVHLADCPPEVEAAILRMLAKDPAARWPRIADAMAALGAQPLADDDPLRLELTQLVAARGQGTPEAPGETTSRAGASTTASGSQGTAVAGIAILPPPTDLEVGDSFMLVALVRGPNGARVPSGSVTWSADPPGVLKLDSAGGPAVAVAAGSTQLIATCRGAQAVLRVEVSPPRADEIVIDPPEYGVRAGDEIHLEATVRDKRGRLVGRPVLWQTADPGTAMVTETGALLAQAPGLARITAVLDSVRAGIVVPILPARVTAIQVSPPPPAIAGDTLTLMATPVDRWGSPLPDRTVLWSSSDVRVAVVAAGGRVHALRPGPVVLTASCEGISEALKVDVAVAPVAAPPVPPAPLVHRRLRRRRPRRLLAGTLGAGLAAGLIWVVDRPDPPTVSAALPEPAGYVSNAPARDTTTATPVAITRPADPAPRPAEGARPRGEVRPRPRVKARTVTSISISPMNPLRVGDSAILRAVVLDTRGAAWEDSTLTWHSSRAWVATIDSATGLVHARAPGTAVITARSAGDSASLELTVLPPAVAHVILHGAPPLLVGQSLMLLAIPTDAEGNALRERPVAWASSDPAILEVDSATGLIAARSPGSVDVTATSEGTSSVVRVTVFARDRAARLE